MSERKLTPEEIEAIVNKLPSVNAATKESGELIRNGIIKWMRDCLNNQDFNPEAIKELIKEITVQHYDSRLVPGSTIGSSAAEAIGAGNTQTALNTFHSSGSNKSVTSTIQLMKELIDVKNSRSMKTITIIPTYRRLTFEQGLNMRVSLVGSKINHFLKNFQIFPVDQEQMWWHDFFEIPKESVFFLRLYLDTQLLYKHEVTTSVIAKQLENHPDDLNAVVTAFSPTYQGIIDIFPTSHIKLPERIAKNIEKELSEEEQISIGQKYFLHDIIIPRLKTLVVKGIDGIDNIFPIAVPIFEKIVRNKKRLTDKTSLLFLNNRQMKVIGMDQNQLFRLVKEINKMVNDPRFIVLYETEEPNQIEFHSIVTDNPEVIVNSAIKMSKNEERLKTMVLLKSEIDLTDSSTGSGVVSVPYDITTYIFMKMYPNFFEELTLSKDKIKCKIMKTFSIIEEYISKQDDTIKNNMEKSSEYIYLEAVLDPKANEIATFKEVLLHPNVDQNYTVSNDIHGTAAILGIEACRTIYGRELNDITKGTINPANILFAAEFVTSKGRPLGTTSTSLHEQGLGHLSQASYEKAIEFLKNAALHSGFEGAQSISASIVMGSEIKAGTGYFDIGCDIDGKSYVNSGVYSNFVPAKPSEKIDPVEIATREYEAGVLPLYVIRRYPNGTVEKVYPTLDLI